MTQVCQRRAPAGDTAQEAEILNLLRVGQREAFEARLQQFRRLQLSQSKAGKGKLCRLINHVVRTDGQYATVLIEDISNLLNDGDQSVRADALAAFAASAHLFMFHVLLARALHPDSATARDAFADLACALSLVRHAAATMDASDCRGKNGLASVAELVHTGSRSPVANALRVVMMELAVLAQLGVAPPPPPSGTKRRQPSPGKDAPASSTERRGAPEGNFGNDRANSRVDSDDWRCIVNADAAVMKQLGHWSARAARLLLGCLCSATKSNKPAALTRSLLAAEVVATLVAHYPHQYFCAFVPALVATHTHLFRTVGAYENMILRVFMSQAAQPFHPQLVALLNEAGYQCELPDMYKRAHVAAAGNRCYVQGGEGPVLEEDAVNVVSMLAVRRDAEARFQLATQKTETTLKPAQLQEFKAAQIFECDALAVRFLRSPDNVFNCANAELRLAPPRPPADEPALELECAPNPKYAPPAAVAPVVPTSCESIRENRQLYSVLVATQMMDTAVSYTWHLRGAVVAGSRRGRFDAFNRALFNKLFLAGSVPRDTQRSLFAALMDHLAQMVMVGCAAPEASHESGDSDQPSDALLAPALADARNVGVEELLATVASDHWSAPLERLLDYVSEMLMTKACLELARGVAQGKGDYVARTLREADADVPVDGKVEAEGSDAGDRASYGELVELALSKLYAPGILEIVDVRDVYVLQICKFILNLPFIPLSLVKQISGWLADPTSRRLAFSLISNILKKSPCPDLKERVLALFLRSVVADDGEVRGLFLRLVSSPKGLYHVNADGRRYSVRELEMAHDALLAWARAGGGCAKCKLGPYLSAELMAECEVMAGRPLWLWPSGLLGALRSAHTAVGTRASAKCKGCEFQQLADGVARAPLKARQPALDWSLLPSVWLEELFALLARPDSANAHPFLVDMARQVRLEERSSDTVEPLVVAAGKNPALVPFVCELAPKLGEDTAAKARRNCCAHTQELVHLIRHQPQGDAFLVTLLGDVRAMWLDPRYDLLDAWRREGSPAKQLVETALGHLGTCEDYILQLVPFLAVEQLEAVVARLFSHSGEESLKRVLALLMAVPPTFRREQKELNFALPQHFMYQCYSVKPSKELLKRQTGLLDHCVDCCVAGQMGVEAALSACTLIVESPEEVSFVFGRVLCQLVQKVPQTRSVTVQAILPALFKREAWENKMLWRGVVICMTTLWPWHKEHLCRLLLLLPQEQGEATIKTLQTQHNIIAFMESTLPQLDHTVHIPAYIKMMLSL
ncbi:symplekin tight junction carboxy-terminal protein [Babesia caballi]|uniref:Symplekin tight junction carboxy-terminal protein n=1 Tax=Babesia caballi TaxID=5871 RepID=A0AAV4LY11_BABCB|nr:symplekin tight junction carboxy-terminal protein [Babesia caballi]